MADLPTFTSYADYTYLLAMELQFYLGREGQVDDNETCLCAASLREGVEKIQISPVRVGLLVTLLVIT